MSKKLPIIKKPIDKGYILLFFLIGLSLGSLNNSMILFVALHIHQQRYMYQT